MADDTQNRLDAHLREQRDQERTKEEREHDFLQLVRATYARVGQHITQGSDRRVVISEPENNEKQLGIKVLPPQESVPEFSYYISIDRNRQGIEEVFGRGP